MKPRDYVMRLFLTGMPLRVFLSGLTPGNLPAEPEMKIFLSHLRQLEAQSIKNLLCVRRRTEQPDNQDGTIRPERISQSAPTHTYASNQYR